MTVPPPKWVVFDLMRVLLEWEPERLYTRLLPDEGARKAFFSRTGILQVNAEATRSGDLQSKISQLAAAHPQDADRISAWWAQWTQMCFAPIAPMEAFLRRLKAGGVKVCGFSNFSDDALGVARERYSILSEFDSEVIFCRKGFIKPEPEIYAEVEETTAQEGEALFFLDDKGENIRTAQLRGWRTHLFDGWSNLRAKLPEVGLADFAPPSSD